MDTMKSEMKENTRCPLKLSEDFSWTTTTVKQIAFSHVWNIHGINHILARSEAAGLKSADFTSEKYAGCTWILQANLSHLNKSSVPGRDQLRLSGAVNQIKSSNQIKSNQSDNLQYVSLYLALTANERRGTEIIGACEFTLLDINNQPLKQWGTQEERHSFTNDRFSSKEYILRVNELTNPMNKYIEGDKLRIRCQVWLDGEIKTSAHYKDIDAKRLENELCADFQKLFEDTSFHDVILKTDKNAFQAHKAVLAARSTVFLAMLQSEMAEAINGVIEIKDFEDDIVKQMLQYIYGGEVENWSQENTLDLLSIADKYDIKGLKHKCLENIPSILCVENVIDILVSIDLYDLPELKSTLMDYAVKNIEAVKKTKMFDDLINVNGALMLEIVHKIV